MDLVEQLAHKVFQDLAVIVVKMVSQALVVLAAIVVLMAQAVYQVIQAIVDQA